MTTHDNLLKKNKILMDALIAMTHLPDCYPTKAIKARAKTAIDRVRRNHVQRK